VDLAPVVDDILQGPLFLLDNGGLVRVVPEVRGGGAMRQFLNAKQLTVQVKDGSAG